MSDSSLGDYEYRHIDHLLIILQYIEQGISVFTYFTIHYKYF